MSKLVSAGGGITSNGPCDIMVYHKKQAKPFENVHTGRIIQCTHNPWTHNFATLGTSSLKIWNPTEKNPLNTIPVANGKCFAFLSKSLVAIAQPRQIVVMSTMKKLVNVFKIPAVKVSMLDCIHNVKYGLSAEKKTILIAADKSGNISAYDVINNFEIFSIRCRSSITTITHHPISGHIICGTLNGNLQIYSLADGLLASSIKINDGPINDIQLDKFGKRAWIASGPKIVTIVWSHDFTIISKKPILGHRGQILKLTLSPNQSRLASLATDKTLRVWKCTGKNLRVVRIHNIRFPGWIAYTQDVEGIQWNTNHVVQVLDEFIQGESSKVPYLNAVSFQAMATSDGLLEDENTQPPQKATIGDENDKRILVSSMNHGYANHIEHQVENLDSLKLGSISSTSVDSSYSEEKDPISTPSTRSTPPSFGPEPLSIRKLHQTVNLQYAKPGNSSLSEKCPYPGCPVRRFGEELRKHMLICEYYVDTSTSMAADTNTLHLARELAQQPEKLMKKCPSIDYVDAVVENSTNGSIPPQQTTKSATSTAHTTTLGLNEAQFEIQNLEKLVMNQKYVIDAQHKALSILTEHVKKMEQDAEIVSERVSTLEFQLQSMPKQFQQYYRTNR